MLNTGDVLGRVVGEYLELYIPARQADLLSSRCDRRCCYQRRLIAVVMNICIFLIIVKVVAQNVNRDSHLTVNDFVQDVAQLAIELSFNSLFVHATQTDQKVHLFLGHSFVRVIVQEMGGCREHDVPVEEF